MNRVFQLSKNCDLAYTWCSFRETISQTCKSILLVSLCRTRMHSSRMRTACSLTVSCSICGGVGGHACPCHTCPHHAHPLLCMPLCHACPPPHTPPTMHAPHHTCSPTMHAPSPSCMPPPCLPPSHACPPWRDRHV